MSIDLDLLVESVIYLVNDEHGKFISEICLKVEYEVEKGYVS